MYKIINGENEHELLSIERLDNKFIVNYSIKNESSHRIKSYISEDNEQLELDKFDKYLGVVE